MDFKNSITLTCIFNGSKIKFLIPITSIINIFQATETLFGSATPKTSTFILVKLEDYRKLGLTFIGDKYSNPNMNGEMTVEIEEEFKAVVALMKESKAAKILLEN